MEKPWLNYWPKYVPQSIAYPEMSLGEVLRRSAEEAAENVAVHYQDSEITFEELDALVDAFASGLQNLGIQKGDRLAIYLPNIPQFVISYYGALRTGGIVVSMSPLYKERELASILIDSGARIVVSWNRLCSYVQSVREKTKVEYVIRTGADDSFRQLEDSPRMESSLDMRSLLTVSEEPDRIKIEPKKDLALLQYTGGTTGAPKGAMLTHQNLLVNAAQFATWLQMRPGREVHVSALPLFHIYGMTAAMNSSVYTRSSMVLISDARNVNAILHAIDRYQPTIFCGVPEMYASLIRQPDIQERNLRSIRVCVSGAAPLPVEVQRRFEELTGGRLVEGYGLTEASPVTHVTPVDDRSKTRPGSIGIPISDTEAKIVDLESGEHDLPPQTRGELVVRGPQVMIGYWNNQLESSMVLRGGWLYTGDIATMDPDGYFRIVDRKKDMINVSGFKVWPREVEEVLCEHPAIKEAAVVAAPDAASGETIKAFVVLNDQYVGKIAPEQISAFCKEKIAPYKAPRTVEFLETLPKTPVGKILRRKLRLPRRTDFSF